MKQDAGTKTIAAGVITIIGIGLLIGFVLVFWLLPVGGRVLRAYTIAGRAPVSKLLRRITGGWPAEETINANSTACFLAMIQWSVSGLLISAVLVYLGAPLMSLLIGFSAGLLTGTLCSLMKEPQPQRQQTLDDIYPADWRL